MGKMPRPGSNVHIPLPEDQALRLLLKVRPTADMCAPRGELDEGEAKADEEGE